MSSVRTSELPATALLRYYQSSGAYADCYVTDIQGAVSHPQFVEAFYTTPLFKLERLLLRWLAAKPSTDTDAKGLAAGTLDAFAAWRVECRDTNQLLLSDFTGRTRSWLMAATIEPAGAMARTRLYFGSAIVPKVDQRTGRRSLGFLFHALLGFHKLYSRALLRAARSRLAGSDA
jgi:hypothetical protein